MYIYIVLTFLFFNRAKHNPQRPFMVNTCGRRSLPVRLFLCCFNLLRFIIGSSVTKVYGEHL